MSQKSKNQEKKFKTTIKFSLFNVKYLTSQHENSPHRQQDEAHQGNDTFKQNFKLLRIKLAAQVIHKSVNLA